MPLSKMKALAEHLIGELIKDRKSNGSHGILASKYDRSMGTILLYCKYIVNILYSKYYYIRKKYAEIWQKIRLGENRNPPVQSK